MADVQLTQGLTYVGKVQSIKENADRFSKRGGNGGMSYCHFIDLTIPTLGGYLFTVQLCTDYPNLGETFHANDYIKFIAHAHTQGQWTIKFIEKTNGVYSDVHSSKGVGIRDERRTEQSSPPVKYQTVVTGTLYERAMGHTCHLMQMRVCNAGEVIEMADVIYEWMRLKSLSNEIN